MDKDVAKRTKERLEAQINELNIPYSQKKRMQEALLGLFLSPKERLYLRNDSEFQQYLALRKRDEDPSTPYDFCVVDRMEDSYSGSTAGRNYRFLSLREVAELVEENKDTIDSEIVNALNYQRQKEKENVVETEPKKELTEAEKCRESMKKAIEDMQRIPDYKKQRVYDVLEAIADSPNGKITALNQNGVTEAIALREERGVMSYTISSKIIDDFGGSNGFRKSRPISARELVEYIESNRTTIDKEVKKIKSMKQLKAKKSNPDFDEI